MEGGTLLSFSEKITQYFDNHLACTYIGTLFLI